MYSWIDVLCTLCFPPLSQPSARTLAVEEQAVPVATKTKGKAAAAAPPSEPAVVAEPLLPQHSDRIRAAAVSALNSALSTSALERALREKLIMHAVEACIVSDGVLSTVAAAALLKRTVITLVRSQPHEFLISALASCVEWAL